MIPLRLRSPRLCPFYPATLLQGSVVGFYAPTRPLQLFALRLAHLKVVGGPVFGAASVGPTVRLLYLHQSDDRPTPFNSLQVPRHPPSVAAEVALEDSKLRVLL